MFAGGVAVSAREKVALALVLVLAAGLRLAGLGSLPPALHPDEAANAYEARCLLETGRSSAGELLPLVFPHHGVNWVEGAYVWLEAPALALAGDQVEAGARLPAALAGIAAVLATFFLGSELASRRVGLLAALTLAAEPWAVHFSRIGFGPAFEPALLAAGLALAVRALGLPPPGGGRGGVGVAAAVGAGVVLGLATLAYAPARLVVPVLALALVLVRRAPWRLGVALMLPVGGALLLILPFAVSPRGLHHWKDIASPTASDVVRGYVMHFSTRTLFSGEVEQGFAAKGTPPLHWLEGPFILLGIVFAARSEGRARFLVAWLLAFPLAGALTKPAPNLVRAIFGLPLFALLGAVGVSALLDRLERKSRVVRVSVVSILAALALVSVALAAWRYATVFPEGRSAWSAYRGERERVAAMHGVVRVRLPNERALVDLYAWKRRHTWIAADVVDFGE
jgi:4-amino-4-deoxy-L-arabinose transferase-like glycosyltransferase